MALVDHDISMPGVTQEVLCGIAGTGAAEKSFACDHLCRPNFEHGCLLAALL
jgi:hypothetical protein